LLQVARTFQAKMDDMDRHAFISTQGWACEIDESQQNYLFELATPQKIFDGQCCFQSNFLSEDETRLFLYFEVTERRSDFVQLVT
jgi:hypothetical protein